MIGGTDIQIRTGAGVSAIELGMRLAKHLWKSAVFEDAATGDVYQDPTEVPLDKISELLIYKDAAARQSWEKFGAVPSLNNTLIHLLSTGSVLSVVLDNEPDQKLLHFAEGLKNALQQRLFNRFSTEKDAA